MIFNGDRSHHKKLDGRGLYFSKNHFFRSVKRVDNFRFNTYNRGKFISFFYFLFFSPGGGGKLYPRGGAEASFPL